MFLTVCGCPIGTGGGSGGGGDGTDPDPPVSSEPLYAETNAAIADAAETVEQNIPAMVIAEAMAAAARAMTEHECVKSAVCVEDEERDPYLLAEFTNGILYIMHVVRLETGGLDSEEPGDTALPAAVPERSVGMRGRSVPAAAKAIFFDLPEFDTDADALFILAETAGYDCRYLCNWRVEDFRDLDTNGLVYVATHGQQFFDIAGSYYMFTTPQVRNETDDLEYIRNGDFRDRAVLLGNQIYIPEKGDPYPDEEVCYSVSNKYIEKYSLLFPEGSLFYADACQSAYPDAVGDVPLMDTLEALNVTAALGWSKNIYSDYATRASSFLIGQMLGDLEGLMYINFTGPPFRPYSLTDAFTALQHKLWQYDKAYSELQLYGGGEIILRPSISQLIVDVDPELGTEELKILGNFGDRPGSLTICESPSNPEGGSSLSWSDWEENTVIATPAADACGYVVAKVDGIPSNAHPLSRWETNMEVNGTVPRDEGPRIELTIDAPWRAEIAAERGLLTSGSTVPATGWSDPIPESSRAATLFSMESSCDYNFTGTFEDENYIYEYPEGANQGSMPVSLDGTDMFFGTVTLWPDQGMAMF